MSTLRLMYQYTEVVCSRHTRSLGEVHDLRVSNLIQKSQALQGSLRNLKKHFPNELKPSFDSVDNLAVYMHKSFTGSMQYKQPYTPYNVFGPSIDASLLNDIKNPEIKSEMESGLINLTALSAMGMLVVHVFVLEFTMFATALADIITEQPMLSVEGKQKFNNLRNEIFTFLTGHAQDSMRQLGLDQEQPLNSGDVDQLGKLLNASSFCDFLVHPDTIPHLLNTASMNFTPLSLRMIYFTFLNAILQIHQNDEAFDVDSTLKSSEANYIIMKSFALNKSYKYTRKIEDYNMRQSLLNKFKGMTKSPVYKYATLLYPSTSNENSQAVIQSINGQVNVVPRKKVHIWRKKSMWTDNSEHNWKTFSCVHGELSLMCDIMYNTLPLTLANNQYLEHDVFPTEFTHMILTRSLGPDMFAYFGDLIPRYDRSRITLYSEFPNDPKAPDAVSIQPAPNSIKRWVHEFRTWRRSNNVQDVVQAVRSVPTNAIFYRPTTVNLNDVLKTQSVLLKQYNVVFNINWCTGELFEERGTFAFNSVFILNYLQALCYMPLPNILHPLKVYNSITNNLHLTAAQFNLAHINELKGFNLESDLTYPTCRQLQIRLKSVIEKMESGYKTREPPFLHPCSWLCAREIGLNNGDNHTFSSSKILPTNDGKSKGEGDEKLPDAQSDAHSDSGSESLQGNVPINYGWELCDEAMDLNKGTILTFDPLLTTPMPRASREDLWTEQTIFVMKGNIPERNKNVSQTSGWSLGGDDDSLKKGMFGKGSETRFYGGGVLGTRGIKYPDTFPSKLSGQPPYPAPPREMPGYTFDPRANDFFKMEGDKVLWYYNSLPDRPQGDHIWEYDISSKRWFYTNPDRTRTYVDAGVADV
jgi:hypothetical protein